MAVGDRVFPKNTRSRRQSALEVSFGLAFDLVFLFSGDVFLMRGRGAQKIPKIKEYARVTLSNNKVYIGYFFIEATSRIQDVLNSESAFFPLITETGELHLLNKFHVVNVEPLKK